MAHCYSKAELYERKDNDVPPLDLRDIFGKEKEEGEAEVHQSVLARFQNALSTDERWLYGRKR